MAFHNKINVWLLKNKVQIPRFWKKPIQKYRKLITTWNTYTDPALFCSSVSSITSVSTHHPRTFSLRKIYPTLYQLRPPIPSILMRPCKTVFQTYQFVFKHQSNEFRTLGYRFYHSTGGMSKYRTGPAAHRTQPVSGLFRFRFGVQCGISTYNRYKQVTVIGMTATTA